MSLTPAQRAELAFVAARLLRHADQLRRAFVPAVVVVEPWADDEPTEIRKRVVNPHRDAANR